MKLNKDYEVWLRETDLYLPNFSKILTQVNNEIFLIGAVVLNLYSRMNLIGTLTRQTGDIDMSVGLISDTKEYTDLKDAFLSAGYIQDDRLKYRLHTPQKHAQGFSYIDLLAHPKNHKDKLRVQNLIGVGPEWSFDEIYFSLHEKIKILKNIFIPNPIGFIALKMASYDHNPTERQRDLVDISEVIDGLVKQNHSSDMKQIWKKMAAHNGSMIKQVSKMLKSLSGEMGTQYDFDDVEQELLGRGYDDIGLLRRMIVQFLEDIGL